jgi:hypothetical protein
MKLNLGACDRHIEGFISVDIAPPADQIVDLAGPWPWPDSSVDEVLALDVCEHIATSMTAGFALWGMAIEPVKRGVDGRIHFMNELHRVMAPGARVTIETPNAARGCGYFQDPTHVSPWCLSTFKYFEHGTFAHGRLSKAYGIMAAFKVISLDEFETNGEDPREKAWKIKAVLEAVK